MINLIPKEEKKKMMIGFYYRLAILLLIMLDFCILIALFTLLPAYFLSSTKEKIISNKLQVQNSQGLSSSSDQTIATVTSLNGQLGVVEKAEQNKFVISDKIIGAIILNKRPDIKITEISYSNDPVLGKTVSITGIAPSREVLLLFQQALEDNPNFKNVDLPISNFIQKSNIQFSLTLVPV